MLSKYAELLMNLQETRQQVAELRDRYRIDLGEIQVGYECAIENLLEMIGLTEKEIDIFWSFSEPDRSKI